MEPISILNALSATVDNHLSLARNGDHEAASRSWMALAGSVIPPALDLEAIARNKHGLSRSPECGTATRLLSELKDGSSPYSLQKGKLGSYLWSALGGDCLDEIRKRDNRYAILRDKYPARREAGPSQNWYDERMVRTSEALLALGGRTAKVAVLLHLDYWNRNSLFTGDELARIGRILAENGGSMELSQTQTAYILGVANATVSRDVLKIAETARILRDGDDDSLSVAI